LRLLDIAVLVRPVDGALLFDGKTLVSERHPTQFRTLGILAGFALAVPLLSDAAVARSFDSSPTEVANSLGIDEEFKESIGAIMRPGTSALLVLDVAENINSILSGLRGLGGTVLKTNVDIERAELVQSTLAEKMIA
jgi:uncharacterized membrane protein